MSTSMTDCDHPKSEVVITETASNVEVGNSPPRYWTVFAHCGECDEAVEVDYRFEEIL